MFKRIAMIAAAGLMLVGCASIDQALNSSDARKATLVALTTYGDIYQPAVIAYGRLPDCQPEVVRICKERPVLENLKTADAAVSSAVDAAADVLSGKVYDPATIQKVRDAIAKAQTAIGASGALALSR